MLLTTRVCSLFLLILPSVQTAWAQGDVGQLRTRAGDERIRKGEWNGRWRMGLGGETFQEGRDEGMAAFVRLNGQFNYKFNSWLKARVDPRLKFYSSRVQERYSDDAYQGSFRARNAYLAATPTDGVELRAGALAQNFLDSPALISRRRAFPGLQEILSYEPASRVRTSLILQQTVPTSSSLNAEREAREPLPIFQTQSLHARGRNWTGFDWDANVGHYSWSQLPDKVAYTSAVMGNSVPGAQAAPGSRFLYGFDGFFGGGEVLADLDSFQFKAEYRLLKNVAAPADSADAQYWLVGPHVKIGESLWKVYYGQYFVESDATVAQYNQPELGHNNRIGDVILSRVEFPKQGFALKVEWTSSRVISPQFTQASMTSLLFGVETEYASF